MLQKATRTLFTQSQRRMFSVKRYFLVEYEYVEDAYYKKIPHRDQHLKSIDQLRQSGQAKILGAPFFPYTGAAMILETEQEKQQVESVIQNDPYVKNKIVSKWSVKEFEGTTVETRRKFDRIAGDFTFRS